MVKVTLPEGMTLNASSAHTLQACTDKQFGVVEKSPGHFAEHPLVVEEGPINCPPGSRIGTFQVKSPDLPQQACSVAGQTISECEAKHQPIENTPLEGGVYVAAPVPGA